MTVGATRSAVTVVLVSVESKPLTVDLAEMSPIGNKPLLVSVTGFKSEDPNVTLVPVDFLVKIWLPIVKVTVAPGVTLFTTI
ncbi:MULTISPECIES: hypothetical protein [Streptococcus]|uniref:hypothetical protein n=1 Tax=Streptococcus TaxID=1301 RepID=UPI001159A37D